MADHVQLEIFDLKPYESGNNAPDIYMVTQVKKPQGIEGKQLNLDLFLDEPDEGYFNLKRAA